jgi:2-polyprenyl-6-methoxyphenol hydroxylase-like FAD-dependent oxidoreductase
MLANMGERAIVVGGSMAGLLAVRVLADHYREVVLVDRDHLPSTAEQRPGVPQARHAHALLERGRRVLEHFLPGLQEALLADGARLYDSGRDSAFWSWAGEAVRFDSGIPFLAASRALLEHHVRKRVLALPNVRTRLGVAPSGLVGDAKAVSGIRLSDGDLAGDLVVDATGRDSKGPEWLEALGITPPAETVVKPFLGYASRVYEGPATPVWDQVALVAMALEPVFTRGIGMVPIENGKFIVTVIGLNGDYPPTDEAELAKFVRSIPVPKFHAWLDAATPVGPIHGFRYERNRLRHYESCALPAGFITVGDAVVSFNPIYGQGMTTAAIGIELLAEVLAGKPAPAELPRRFHKKLINLLKQPWSSATTEDLRYPGTEGKRNFGHKLAYAYVDRLFILASSEAAVRHTLIEVFGMIKPPSALFSPSMMWRVLKTSIPPDKVRPQDGLARKAVRG